jgi:hypothetical protein
LDGKSTLGVGFCDASVLETCEGDGTGLMAMLPEPTELILDGMMFRPFL